MVRFARFIGKGDGSATAISSDPVVVGYLDDGAGGPTQAFRYDTDTDTLLNLGAIKAGGTSAARGVSSDGSVVVGFSDSNATGTYLGNPTTLEHVFRWTQAGGMVDLGAGAGLDATGGAYGVSGDGNTIVGSRTFRQDSLDSFGTKWAFYCTYSSGGCTFHDIVRGTATAISQDASTVVGRSSSSSSAFRYDIGTDTRADLGTLAGHADSAALAVSDNGKIIVGVSSANPIDFSGAMGAARYTTGGSLAFRWTDASQGGTGMADLNTLLKNAGVDMTGITLVAATGISPDGQWINGAATTPDTTGDGTEPIIVHYCDVFIDGQCFSGFTTPASVGSSLASVANQQNAVTNNVSGTADGLLGFNQPFLTKNNELGVYGAAGSFLLGSNGRWNLNGNTTLIGGAAFTKQSYSGVDVTSAALAAAGLRYTRPTGKDLAAFIEGGGWVAPTMDLTFTRSYANGSGTATGTGSTSGTMANVYARAGFAWTPKPSREIGVAASIGHTWTNVSAYSEASGASNPFPMTFSDRSGATSFVKVQAEWTEALTPKWDMTLSGALGRTFGSSGALAASVTGVGTVSATPSDYTFEEYGARFGYKLSDRDTVDLFAFGSSAQGLGSHFEIGTGFRARL